MDKEMIQLPPLPYNFESQTITLIWEYAKLSSTGKDKMLDMISAMSEEEESAILKAELHAVFEGNSAIYDTIDPKLAKCAKILQDILVQLMRESCELACLVFYDHCIEGKSASEIALQYKVDCKTVELYTGYFDKTVLHSDSSNGSLCGS